MSGRGCELEDMETSYFLSRDIVIPSVGGGMALWREKLFAQMHHNAGAAADFLSLPNNRWWSWARRSRSDTALAQSRRRRTGLTASTAVRFVQQYGRRSIENHRMDLLFVADPLAAFKPYKDSTYAMMREAAARGHRVAGVRAEGPRVARGDRVAPRCARSRSPASSTTGSSSARRPPVRASRWPTSHAVLMRKDPPFDSEYFYATHLLEQAEREGARVFNKPARAARPPGEARHPRIPAIRSARRS